MVTSMREEAPAASADAPKYLRVMVDAPDHNDGRPVHVNVRIPVKLLRLGMRFTGFIPPEAQQRMNEALHEQGMDIDVRQIKREDLDELIDALRDMTIDVDDEQEGVKVKIYAE